jgi:hypothetical protein
MMRKQLARKLNLTRETLGTLQRDELAGVAGGAGTAATLTTVISKVCPTRTCTSRTVVCDHASRPIE